MNSSERLDKAIAAFDAYNSNDPNHESFQGKLFPKELLYAQRMTEHLERFAPNADECLKLAARCQHIGRWEIARSNYSMNKKGYFLWRSEEKMHHAKIAERILKECGYETDIIDKVKFLVLKKELFTNADTQLLEDVVCLVFIEHYLEDFASKHDEAKVFDIIRKTAKKMSARAVEYVGQLQLSGKVQSMLQHALSPPFLFKFEEEFMQDRIRCIPMVVRFKLDACGIKLKLAEWNQFAPEERTHLMISSTDTAEDLLNYKNHLQQLVLSRTGEVATDMPVDKNPAWTVTDKIHEPLLNKLKEFGWSISLSQWQNLSNLQRFALTKLSRPSHENKNFPKAMKEFGLAK